MRTGIVVEVSAADRTRLEAVAADRNSPQKHVWRARIVLLTADGCGTTEIMRRTGKAKTAVWRTPLGAAARGVRSAGRSGRARRASAGCCGPP